MEIWLAASEVWQIVSIQWRLYYISRPIYVTHINAFQYISMPKYIYSILYEIIFSVCIFFAFIYSQKSKVAVFWFLVFNIDAFVYSFPKYISHYIKPQCNSLKISISRVNYQYKSVANQFFTSPCIKADLPSLLFFYEEKCCIVQFICFISGSPHFFYCKLDTSPS